MAALVTQVSALTARVEELMQELRAVRMENAELRRERDAMRGLQQHQPYALTPLPPPTFTYSPPRAPSENVRSASQLSPPPAGLGSPSSVALESKRVRRALDIPMVVDDVEPEPFSATPSAAPLPDEQ